MKIFIRNLQLSPEKVNILKYHGIWYCGLASGIGLNCNGMRPALQPFTYTIKMV